MPPARPGVDPGMTTGLIVLLVVVPLALAFGAWRAYADGRFRGTQEIRQTGGELAERGDDTADEDVAAVPRSVLADSGIDHTLGERATLLQFSSAFCAPCRATRRVLDEIAAVVPGVAHVEVDAEQHLDLVRRLGIARTPTTLVLDRRGAEVTRAAGAPRKEQVLTALARVEGP